MRATWDRTCVGLVYKFVVIEVLWFVGKGRAVVFLWSGAVDHKACVRHLERQNRKMIKTRRFYDV